jgi:hypothetical protein
LKWKTLDLSTIFLVLRFHLLLIVTNWHRTSISLIFFRGLISQTAAHRLSSIFVLISMMANLFMISLYISIWLAALSILLLLGLISHMLSIRWVSSWLLLASLTSLPSFTSFANSKGHYFVGSTSPLSPLFSCMLILMQIEPVILLTVAPPLVIVFYLTHILFLGKVRNNMLLLALAPRQNIVL